MKSNNITNFSLEKNSGFYEEVSIDDIVKEVGTPVYLYSEKGIRDTVENFVNATNNGKVKYKYAIKANTNIEIVKLINTCGFGADVVSIGEAHAALMAGVSNGDIIFAGMGKTIDELKEGLKLNLGFISVESIWEFEQIQKIASDINAETRILIRVNLNIDGSTHPYLTTGREENKFGIDAEKVLENYKKWQTKSIIPVEGIQVHIGSQILDISAFREAAAATTRFVEQLREGESSVNIIDFGGGVGVSYDGDDEISIQDYGQIIKKLGDRLNVIIFLEPGRYLTSTNGILCGSVIYHKSGVTKDFLVTDIGMNDIIRPALYQAYHKVVPCFKGERKVCEKKVDIVGPICESGDFIALSRKFPKLKSGDQIIMATTGAYGYSMSSNYNLRSKPVEVLVQGDSYKVIRKRQKLNEYI